MNKENKLDLIHSELNAEYGSEQLADYAILGLLKAIVTEQQLTKVIELRGWNK